MFSNVNPFNIIDGDVDSTLLVTTTGRVRRTQYVPRRSVIFGPVSGGNVSLGVLKLRFEAECRKKSDVQNVYVYAHIYIYKTRRVSRTVSLLFNVCRRRDGVTLSRGQYLCLCLALNTEI